MGGRILSLIESSSYSQSSLAKELGVSRSLVGKWVKDQNRPPPKMIEAMARLFNVGSAYIAGYDKDSEINPAQLVAALAAARNAHEELSRVITSLEAIHLPPAPPKRSSRQSNKADEWRDLRPPDSPESTQSGDP